MIVTVTGFEDINFFRDFQLVKKKNCHSVCQFTVQNTRKNSASVYKVSNELVGRNVRIYDANSASDKSDGNFIMTGIIDKVEFDSGYQEDLMTVTIVSNSVSLEAGNSIRIFQDTRKTARDILAEIEQTIDGKFVYLDSELGREEIEPIVMQCNENDRVFVEKIAKSMGVDVWYDDKSTEEFKIRLGKYREDIGELEREKFTCFNKIYSGKGICVRAVVSSYSSVDYMDIGQRFCVDGEQYIIEEVNIGLKNQHFIYEFMAVLLSESKDKEKYKWSFPTNTFKARVISQDDPKNFGRVQVDFSAEGVESYAKDDPAWIDVETMYDGVKGGCVFIPDVDDTVDVLFSQDQVFVAGVRRQEALDEKHQNVSEKCIVDAKGRKIVFAEDYLELIAGDCHLQINEQMIKVLCEDVVLQIEKGKLAGSISNSRFEADNDVSVQAGTIHFDTEKNLEFKTDRSTTIESRAINITASGAVEISGKPVSLNS